MNEDDRVYPSGPTCPECGTAAVLTRKWNSGNPTDFWLPDCECEDRRTEADLDRRFGQPSKNDPLAVALMAAHLFRETIRRRPR